ncbi:hypothetical protein P9112_000673 [Eukaryota sp. TZLM1-RC]
MFEMENRGAMAAGRWIPEVVLDNPEAVVQLHKDFADCGAEVLQVINFYSHKAKAQQLGIEIDIHRLNRQAILLAREGVKRSSAAFERPIFVAGALSPLSFFSQREKQDQIMADVFKEQLSAQTDADVIVCETFMSVQEATMAVRACKSQNMLPIVTIRGNDQTLQSDIASLVREEPLAVGLNCYDGPKETLRMMEKVQQIPRPVGMYLACMPVGYNATNWETNPGFPLALESVQINRFQGAKYAIDAKQMGVIFIGGCCGFRPYHIKEMAAALNKPALNHKYKPQLHYSRFSCVRERTGDYWKRFEDMT